MLKWFVVENPATDSARMTRLPLKVRLRWLKMTTALRENCINLAQKGRKRRLKNAFEPSIIYSFSPRRKKARIIWNLPAIPYYASAILDKIELVPVYNRGVWTGSKYAGSKNSQIFFAEKKILKETTTKNCHKIIFYWITRPIFFKQYNIWLS